MAVRLAFHPRLYWSIEVLGGAAFLVYTGYVHGTGNLQPALGRLEFDVAHDVFHALILVMSVAILAFLDDARQARSALWWGAFYGAFGLSGFLAGGRLWSFVGIHLELQENLVHAGAGAAGVAVGLLYQGFGGRLPTARPPA
ncbi:MAG: hypothetical protein V4510_13325 [bacterium]